MLSTRYHLGSSALGAVLTVVLLVLGASPGWAQLNGQIPLAGKSIPKFVEPLPTFVGARVDAVANPSLTVRIAELTQQILPAANAGAGIVGYPVTKVWGYEISSGGTVLGPLHSPSFTVETRRGIPASLTYINDLGSQTLYTPFGGGPGILPVDQTIHWAAPTGMMMGNMGPYTGTVPVVTHLHGGEVPSAIDGGPEAWFTPGNAITGPAFNSTVNGVPVGNTYTYPNTQEAATLWFHDHALGATRLNVYAGLAAFYLLRDNYDTGLQSNPLGLPAGAYEIEIAIQDRMFDTNGQLYFPNIGINPTLHPYWQPEFFGDVIMVNGKTWPYLNVEPRRYRFRMLDGSNARFYALWLQNVAAGTVGPPIYVIGTDGGLLDTPVKLDPALKQRLFMAPGERADIIIDFSGFAGQTLTMKNEAKAPYPGGAPADPKTVGQIMQFRVSAPVTPPVDNTYNPALAGPLRGASPIVRLVAPNATVPAVTVQKTRLLTLNEIMGPLGPYEVLVNNSKWVAATTELPTEGETEVWKIANLTADVHPIHLHLVQFQLVSRQPFSVSKYSKVYNAAFPAATAYDPMMGMTMTYAGGVFVPAFGPPLAYNTANAAGDLGGNPDITPYLQRLPVPANPEEQGWKDTFKMWPGEVTTVIVRFAPTDLPTTTPQGNLKFAFNVAEGPGYVWHCHIVDHEDNEMMRRYSVNVNPLPPVPLVIAKAASEAAISAEVPTEFSLGQNYPNPFNPSTDIRFSLPQDNHVTLRLYNTLGQEVKTLIDADAPAGYHTVRLDAGNLSSGMYLYRIQAGNFSAVKKMTVLK